MASLDQGPREQNSPPSGSAPRSEELAQQAGALGLEHPAGHLGAVVEGGLGEHGEDAAGGAGLGVGGAEDDGGNAGEDDGAGAHRAGLEGHVEGRAGQAPTAQRLGGGADGEDLGVGRWVGILFALVAGGGEHLVPARDHGTDRHVTMVLGFTGALDRQCHHPLSEGLCRVAVHAYGSMWDYNFTGGPVLGRSPLHCRDSRAKRKMNRRLPIAATSLLAALVLVPTPAGAAVGLSAAHGFVPHRLIVKLAGSERSRTVALPERTSVEEAAAALRANPAVEYAAPDYIATASAGEEELASTPPNDPGPISGSPGPPGGWVAKQWNFLPWDGVGTPLVPVSAGGIDAVGAWEHLKATGRPGAEGITVAVLDTGIAYRSLGKQFRHSPDFTAGQFVKGHDFVDGDRLPLDENGHGTHVAGTIAEKTNNGIGLTGLAFRAKLMPVRVLDAQGRGRADQIAKGIHFAAANGADVINMSFNFGCGREVPGVDEALRQAYHQGVITVASVGNLGSEACVSPPATSPHTIGVGGSTEGGCLGAYSLAGRDVDLTAPGGGPPLAGCASVSSSSIYQVTLKAGSTRRFGEPGRYVGTSMSAAHASGVSAMVLASGTVGRKRTPSRVEAVTKRLRLTARDLGQPTTRQGAGLIDAAAATLPSS
jgi:serine protease